MRILIIEDEPAVLKELVWFIKQDHQLILLGTATNVKDALVLIKATGPELILMDIQLVDGTAFDILNQLAAISFKIIFITAYSHFAIKAIKYGALDYLLKPLDEMELKEVLNSIKRDKEIESLQLSEQLAIVKNNVEYKDINLESRIVLHSLDFLQILQLKEIIYCQSDGGYTTFFLSEGRKLMISKPLKFYDELLPEKWFLRPHQSYLVNVLHIDKFLKAGTIVMKDKTEIPVASRRRDYIIQHFKQIV
ncbi:LytTR family DNA-binding domain-containing protein [Pedobacter sp. UYP1]|jgi:two-component system LytT family response regulator|uniref:LytR/AlgR family response regulator transcription factor n=1 Tax=Pedobacter sp. UYP1 TaxID=1756396 RepID=UPI003399BCC4